MTSPLRIAIAVVFAAVLLVGVLLVLHINGAIGGHAQAPGATQTYTNSTYNYSIQYPAGDMARELLPEFVTIEVNSAGALTPEAEIAVLHAGRKEPLPSYDDFERLSVELACGLDPKVTGGVCSIIASKSSFKSDAGAQGNMYNFSSSGGGEDGPFYAFNVSSNVSGGKYAVLLIYPPEGTAGDPALLHRIASSLQLQK